MYVCALIMSFCAPRKQTYLVNNANKSVFSWLLVIAYLAEVLYYVVLLSLCCIMFTIEPPTTNSKNKINSAG